MIYFLMLIGLVALVGGAELLVRGSSRLAAMAGIPSLIVGLTVVAFGTSAPELAISLKASFAGDADIAVGNIVGSNILNILFILGFAAIVAPLAITHQLLRLDVPVLIAASALVWITGRNGSIGRLEGGVMIAILAAYMVILIIQARKRPADAPVIPAADAASGPVPSKKAVVLRSVAIVLIGLFFLTLGARWLVDGAVTLAEAFGISELIIGLTIIAIGTSLPEAATTLVASLRGERDIAVGNAVGSSILNILLVLGVSSIIAPGGLTVASDALAMDIPFMIATAVACLPLFFTGGRLSRGEGALFLAYYTGYMVYLILRATDSQAIEPYGTAVMTFVLPLTGAGIIISLIDHFRKHGKREAT